MLSKGELEYIRPWVSMRLTAVLGGYNPTVIDAALDCIAKSLNRQSTSDKLRTYLEHETPSFVDDLYRKVLEVKSSGIVKDINTGKRELSESDKNEDMPSAKRKQSRFDHSSSSPLSQTEVHAMLQTTRKQIEERRQQTQALVMGHSTPTPKPVGGYGIVSDAVEKARKAAELQARIKSQLAAKPNLLATMKDKIPILPSKPVPLVLDSEGKAELPIAVRAPTLMANIKAHQKYKFQKISQQNQKKEEAFDKNPYFDSRVTQMTIGRGRKQFKFNEPGKFVKLGQTMRFKAQLEKLQSEIASSARKTGISSATRLALIAPTTEEKEDDIPLVEWWDADLLPNRTYADYERDVPPESKYREISNLVEHPVPVLPIGVPSKSIVVPVMLTKKERKKIRKQRRREIELEKQEKIRFGFVDKPEPKVRISNLMRVLGTEAVQDPTKITAQVKAQIAARLRKHEEANTARKLTDEEKRAKKIKKITENTSTGVHVSVYRVADLSNQSNKFKVDMNAQQYHLTGRVLTYPGMNLVIVEGGPKALKKYKSLMLHRIKWNQTRKKGGAPVVDDDDSDNEGGDSSKRSNKCLVVWEGIRDERSFTDWQFKHCSSESIAREHLKKYKTEHYWDMALSESIVELDGDN